jgi:hypothetical protein
MQKFALYKEPRCGWPLTCTVPAFMLALTRSRCGPGRSRAPVAHTDSQGPCSPGGSGQRSRVARAGRERPAAFTSRFCKTLRHKKRAASLDPHVSNPSWASPCSEHYPRRPGAAQGQLTGSAARTGPFAAPGRLVVPPRLDRAGSSYVSCGLDQQSRRYDKEAAILPLSRSITRPRRWQTSRPSGGARAAAAAARTPGTTTPRTGAWASSGPEPEAPQDERRGAHQDRLPQRPRADLHCVLCQGRVMQRTRCGC